jgi:microcystin-dependent protein
MEMRNWINANQAIFALLGTTYGADGRTTFTLPNLRGRVPIHADGGMKQRGEEYHTLTFAEMPVHSHL